jgi:hypothetical protein
MGNIMTNNSIETAATSKELIEAEVNAAEKMRRYLEFYEHFPVAKNFDLVVEKMREYQNCWMNGRRRT